MCVVTILARPIAGVRSEHGEGPVYDPLTDELLWVDIPAGLVNVARLGPGFEHVRSYATGDVVSAVVPRRDPADGWVVASRHGFSALDRSGVVTAIAEPEHTADRMNDGKCDPFGGFWAGSMGPAGHREPLPPRPGRHVPHRARRCDDLQRAGLARPGARLLRRHARPGASTCSP